MNDCALIAENNEHLRVPIWGIKRKIVKPAFSAEIELSPFNQRIVLLSYQLKEKGTLAQLVELLDTLSKKNGFSKVWGKIPEEESWQFLSGGFIKEAVIPGYFGPGNDAAVCSRFYGRRKLSCNVELNSQMIKEMQQTVIPDCDVNPVPDYHIRMACKDDIQQMADLYQQVFSTYPYPIYDPVFLQSSMEHTRYALVFRDNLLAAAASAEMNFTYKNAEMTDFATLPSERGKGLACFILQNLEQEMKTFDIHCLYTIARSTSPGMNRVFMKMAYQYTGTLVNNCHIAGDFDDMNVYYKMI